MPEGESDFAIEVDSLVKSYGPQRAVDSISFAVKTGEVVALLGANGAGKSTTVEILEGHRKRTSGSVKVLGLDPERGGRSFRDRIGVVLQSSGIDRELTVREVLRLYGAAYSNRRSPDELLELVDLTEKADDRVQSLSGGQQRRIDLALGLVGTPDLLFLDEPTTGFDPAARRRSWDLISNLTSHGSTVVLTTHYMDEAEHLADRVMVLDQGHIVATGTPDELRSHARSSTIIRFKIPVIDEPVASLLAGVSGQASGRNGTIEINTEAPTADLARITTWAAQRHLELEDLAIERPSLEDIYLGLLSEPTAGRVEEQEL